MAYCSELFESVLRKSFEIWPGGIGEVILEYGDIRSILLEDLSGSEG